jgi:hypothetical protein
MRINPTDTGVLNRAQGLLESSPQFNSRLSAHAQQTTDDFEQQDPRLLEGTRWARDDCATDHPIDAVQAGREIGETDNDLRSLPTRAQP